MHCLLNSNPPDFRSLGFGHGDAEQAVPQTGPHIGGIDPLSEAEGSLKGSMELLGQLLLLLCWSFGLRLLLGGGFTVGGRLVHGFLLALGFLGLGWGGYAGECGRGFGAEVLVVIFYGRLVRLVGFGVGVRRSGGAGACGFRLWLVERRAIHVAILRCGLGRLWLMLDLLLGVAGDPQGVLISDLDLDILLLEAGDFSINLVSFFVLADVESGAEGALALLPLAVGFAACFAVQFAQQLIDLAEEGDERWEGWARDAAVGGLGWCASPRAALRRVGGCEAGSEEEGHCWWTVWWCGCEMNRWNCCRLVKADEAQE